MNKSDKQMLNVATGFLLVVVLAGCGFEAEFGKSACERAFEKVFDCRDAVEPFTLAQRNEASGLIEEACDLVYEHVSCDVDPRLECAVRSMDCDELFRDSSGGGGTMLNLVVALGVFEDCPDITADCEAEFDRLVTESADLVQQLVMLLLPDVYR